MLAVAALLLPPRLEREVRARIEAALSRHGLLAHLQSVELGISPPLRLARLSIEKQGSGSLLVSQAAVTFRLRGRGLLGRARITLGRVTVQGPAAFSAELAPTLWDVEAVPPDGLRAMLREPAQGLAVTWSPTSQGGRFEAQATAAPAGRLLSVRRAGVPLLDAGVVDGTLHCEAARQATSCDLEIDGRGVRMAALSNGEAAEQPAFGLPADVRLLASGSWRPAGGALDLPSLRLSTAAASLTGALALRDALRDPSLTLTVDVARVDFARLLGTSGLDQPQAVAAFGSGAPGELGSAALGVRVEGRVADAASFKVLQKVEFTPPPRALPALERLRGDFAHPVDEPDGSRTVIEVSPASPDFIPLAEVPPLFVQTLLLGEDAGFFAHRGIDLAELPAAILTNWARSQPTRGASTITQQLAKNLFLSREKRVGRKLHELCLALLLESRLSKQRILEIYLNVIEWGPRLHGLRPASRRYFSREPAELTPKQMAFLVALIPGPLKYQRSFTDRTPSPGFLRLVENLLAKLRSLSALDEAAYQSALAEPLVVATWSLRDEPPSF